MKALSGDEQDYGEVTMNETRDLVLPFQNEYLYAELVQPGQPDRESEGEVLCTVPDLISLCGTDGYMYALRTRDLRYGVRVSVVAFVAHPHRYTAQGIESLVSIWISSLWAHCIMSPSLVVKEFQRSISAC